MAVEFARLQVLRSDEAEQIQRRHIDFVRGLAEQASTQLDDGHYANEWLDRLESELDNVRSALQLALANNDLESAALIVTWLELFWLGRGHTVEARTWLQKLLDLPASEGLMPRLLAHCYRVGG